MDAKLLLEEIRLFLASAPLTARTREQRAKCETYARVVADWEFRPPTTAQAQALLECTVELHHQVTGRVASEPAVQVAVTRTPTGRIASEPAVQVAVTRTPTLTRRTSSAMALRAVTPSKTG
jgi:hypothetical protein